ncbi:UDP-N-acetyl glucosamine 2-epimerase [Mesoterricola sediminis]|uniref:UDP-N-acetyl glucosamine 2-epimerase n=2 Tax=Mesoterricola sediminis TaxID=2927980 RepID=A0AA48HBK2_9BACT|nr:UDP-N-acetylglucosamine 2-epimerase (non-hydrolyzing) [Mesoterricola sediminis]BDU75288.1 UDP-N-acetyl glucosamine 2-epimerase [Mesoterricola sediminis]
MTILGTRPEIIRLSRIIEALDATVDHTLVHTGQNFDPRLNELFFDELGLRGPDHHLGAKGAFGEQVGTILTGTESLIREIQPDRLLILGDTNSGLGAIVAKRMGVPVFHMEAGNRCYDDRVPEEVNRRIIDHSSDVLMPYTERSKQNLLKEGIPGQRIYVTGNPILEVIRHYEPQISQSRILQDLNLSPSGFFLVTMHRAENVDVESRLAAFLSAFDRLQRTYGIPVIVSTHPRTRLRLQNLATEGLNPEVRFLEPFGFFDFIALEKSARCVLSDSGTVQEECAIFGVPSVTIRDVTERPETIECGSGVLSGAGVEQILTLVRLATGKTRTWEPPKEYMQENVSDVVLRILIGHLHRTGA